MKSYDGSTLNKRTEDVHQICHTLDLSCKVNNKGLIDFHVL